MKKIVAVAAVILWAVAIIQGIGMFDGSKEEEVILAFHSMSIIHSYGKYKGDYLTVEEQKILLKNMADALGIVDNFTLEESRDQYGRKVTLLMDGKEADTKLEFITNEKEADGNAFQVDQYLKAELQIQNSIESAFYYDDTIKMLMVSIQESLVQNKRMQLLWNCWKS